MHWMALAALASVCLNEPKSSNHVCEADPQADNNFFRYLRIIQNGEVNLAALTRPQRNSCSTKMKHFGRCFKRKKDEIKLF